MSKREPDQEIAPWPIIERDLVDALLSAKLVKNETDAQKIIADAFATYAWWDEEQMELDGYDAQLTIQRQAFRIAERVIGSGPTPLGPGKTEVDTQRLSPQEQGRFELAREIIYRPLLQHYGSADMKRHAGLLK